MAKDITTKPNTDISPIMDDILNSAGEGIDYDTNELQIPFVRAIQALSPQIKKSDPLFINGASQGDLFNTVTGEFWDGEEGIEVIPCYQETKYLEFVPREQGGGFVGEIEVDSPVLSQTKRDRSVETLPNGNQLVKSDQHYRLILNKDGSAQPAIIDMKSSALKVSRRWKTQIAMFKIKDAKGEFKQPALIATRWRIKTMEESNELGTWFNLNGEKVALVDTKALFNEAKNFRSSIMKGEAKAVVEEPKETPF